MGWVFVPTPNYQLDKKTIKTKTTMAKYAIIYRCGHTAEVQLYGKYEDREKKIAYYKTIDCPECRAKEAADKAKADGLAELTGSPKQVSWASDIRSEKLADAEKLATQVNKNKNMFDGAVETMKAETSASWWIDRRDDTIMDILKELLIK